jgi:hypothetical protein
MTSALAHFVKSFTLWAFVKTHWLMITRYGAVG